MCNQDNDYLYKGLFIFNGGGGLVEFDGQLLQYMMTPLLHKKFCGRSPPDLCPKLIEMTAPPPPKKKEQEKEKNERESRRQRK